VFYQPSNDSPRRQTEVQDHGLEVALDHELI
jgi:hypothetical protein